MNSTDFDFRRLENVLAFESGDVEFDFGRIAEDNDVYDDEDDSNDEDNWRNDYPDEDPGYLEEGDDTGHHLPDRGEGPFFC